jgi:predicted nucleic acid-binding protein
VIVLDSSAAVDYLVNHEPRASWVAERILADPDLHAPHLLDLEVIGALRRRVLKGELSRAGAWRALADLVELDVTRYPHLLLVNRIWELRHDLQPPDASFVALAEVLGAVLVTTDRRQAVTPGIRTRVESFHG